MMLRRLLFMALLAIAGSAWAGNKEVVVGSAWVSETVPGQTTASVRLVLTSVAGSGKLVAVESPAAESAEMQRMWPSGGKIKMSKVRNVRLPRGHAVEFGGQDVSLMLLGLKHPLKVGDHVPVSLTVLLSGGQKVTVDAKAEVRPLETSYKQYQQQQTPDHPKETPDHQ